MPIPKSNHTHALVVTFDNTSHTCCIFHAPLSDKAQTEFAGKMARAYIKSVIPMYAKDNIQLTKANFKLIKLY